MIRLGAPDNARSANSTVRYETPPGEQAQADWAYCGRFADQLDKLVSGRHVASFKLSFERILSSPLRSNLRFGNISLLRRELSFKHKNVISVAER